MSIVLLLVSVGLAFPMTSSQRRFIKEHYGDKFSVDDSYPLAYNVATFGTIKLFNGQPRKMGSFPPKTLLALIHTVPKNVQHIIDAQNTWCRPGLQKKFGYTCAFILVQGTVDRPENAAYKEQLLAMNSTAGDIYFIEMPDLKEGWFTLQMKNIASYIFAMQAFPGYKWYARVDDEILVVPELLIPALVDLNDTATTVGELYMHPPFSQPKRKYYDPLCTQIGNYFPYPAGFFSLFSRDMTEFFADWGKYYKIAPSALEDPGFGHLIYRFGQEQHKWINFVMFKNFGGNFWSSRDVYMTYHRQDHQLDVHGTYWMLKQKGFFNEK